MIREEGIIERARTFRIHPRFISVCYAKRYVNGGKKRDTRGMVIRSQKDGIILGTTTQEDTQ